MTNEILLADDEATFRKTLAKVLQDEGMTVTAVDNGSDAIDLIMKKSFAVAGSQPFRRDATNVSATPIDCPMIDVCSFARRTAIMQSSSSS